MASKKMKRKYSLYDVEQFRAADPPSQWPAGVIQNALSATGYSYGTLSMIPAPIGGGMLTRDGFEIADGEWLVHQNSVVFALDNATLEQYLVDDI